MFLKFFSIVFLPVICFREVFFRKAIIHFVLPNIFFKVLLIFFMCQCFFITSIEFGNERLYVTEKRIMPARIGLEIFKSDLLLRLSTLLI